MTATRNVMTLYVLPPKPTSTMDHGALLLDHTAAMSTTETTVSAPGKVLLAGGYLVLESPHVGLVMAADKRFYSTVVVSDDATPSNKSMTIVVRSPQFHSSWIYQVSISDNTFELKPTEEKSPNVFVEKTLRVTLAYLWTAGLLSSLPSNMDIVIRADNDFYSVLPHLEERYLNPTYENVASLPPFLPCPIDDNDKPIVCKTGLGSSAALVTSLVGSLLQAYEVELDTRAHNLAQICHCHAQGKVGSGFDVSSAVYGSHVYERFPKSTLTDLLVLLDEGDISIPKDTATTLESLVTTKWQGGVVAPLEVPSGLQLLLADVCGGSESPSMARKVLQWKQQSEREQYWENLVKINDEIVALWSELPQDLNVDELSSQTYKDWKEDSVLTKLREAFLQARKNLKAMGEAAEVPIEPDAQTALADATMELPGVVAAVVPGAGGYDAIACLHVDSDEVRDSIAKLWANWKGDGKVCTLAVKAGSYGDGLRHERDFTVEEKLEY